MSLVSTGKGPVKGPATSTDQAVVRFDGTTGELVEDSGVTIDDAGNLTATKFIGDGTGLTGVSGAGDVAGDTVSIDNHVVRWDGITGKVIQDKGVVAISDIGEITGAIQAVIGKLTIEDINSGTLTNFVSTVPIRFNGDFTVWTGGNASTSGSLTGGSMMLADQRLLTTGANMDMNLEPNGTGKVIVPAIIQAMTGDGSPGLRVKQEGPNQSTIIDFYKDINVRKGWYGYGSSTDRDQMFMFNDVGGITITPSASKPITLNGPIKMGSESDDYPGIKIKLLKGTSSSSSTGNVTIAHGLVGGSILSVTGIMEHAVNQGITPGYEAGGGSFDWDVWFDTNTVNIVNNGSSITNKFFRIMVVHT